MPPLLLWPTETMVTLLGRVVSCSQSVLETLCRCSLIYIHECVMRCRIRRREGGYAIYTLLSNYTDEYFRVGKNVDRRNLLLRQVHKKKKTPETSILSFKLFPTYVRLPGNIKSTNQIQLFPVDLWCTILHQNIF